MDSEFCVNRHAIQALQDPLTIRISTEVNLLLREVHAELADFTAMGDFSSEVAEQIRQEFLPQRLSDTLNIEGVRVNPRITRAILEGQALSQADRYNEREVVNAIRANDFMEEQARADEVVRPIHIRQLQKLVCDSLLQDAGTFRIQKVEITGAAIEPPPAGEVPRLVRELCDQAAAAAVVDPIALACWMHASFGAIHPFVDGNGRTGRLLQDWLLVRAGFLPVGIPAMRREEYYEALEAADQGNWMPLVAIVANSQLTALERARRVAEAPKRRLERIRSLVQASQSTIRQRDYTKYEVWRRRIDGIRDEFQRWASDLSQEAPDLQIRTKVWDTISFDKWQEIRERGRTRGTWVFSVNFVVKGRPVFSWLFYARRHEFSYAMDQDEVEKGLVGVFLTGDAEPDPRYDFGKFSDPIVKLRELLYIGDCLHAYREASASELEELGSEDVTIDLSDDGRWVTEEEVVLGDVIETFLEQCLLKFGLIE